MTLLSHFSKLPLHTEHCLWFLGSVSKFGLHLAIELHACFVTMDFVSSMNDASQALLDLTEVIRARFDDSLCRVQDLLWQPLALM